MRKLRLQLIELLIRARREQRLHAPEPRLAAILVGNLLNLLFDPPSQRTAMRWRSITHGSLHRHVFTIRCPDQAFYLDAVKGYLVRRNIQPLEQQTVVFHLKRDADGVPQKISPPGKDSQDHCMFIAVHISATTSPDARPLARDFEALLKAVDASVRDFPAMQEALGVMVRHLSASDPESAELLRWLNDNRYICFGLMPEVSKDDGRERPASAQEAVPADRLGAFRNRHVLHRLATGLYEEIDALQPPIRPGLEWQHLPACQRHLYSILPVELVRVCWKVGSGLHSALLFGHFSRSARHANASQVPLLRNDWRMLLQQKLLIESAYYRREIRTLFDRMPKSLLLGLPAVQWLEPLKAFADLTGRVQTHTMVFAPPPGRMQMAVACLPADRFGPNVLHSIERHFAAIGLCVLGHESFGVGTHRIVLLACTGPVVEASLAAAAIQESVVFWMDRARTHVLQQSNQMNVPDALARLSRLPPVYQNLFPPEQFIDDIRAADWVKRFGRIRVHVRSGTDGVDIQIFTPEAIPLGRVVSIVQSFGLTAMREAVVELAENGASVFLSSLACTYPVKLGLDAIDRLALALDHVLNDKAENEAINALVLSAGLDIQQVAVLATLRNHLVQLLPDAAPLMMTEMLNRHPETAACLYHIFEARHRPAMPAGFAAQARQDFDKALEAVTSLTNDRWFRALAELVDAGLRTNVYAREAGDPIAIKIDPRRLIYAPKPVPYREIFVHGVHVDGVHLRAGPIARGGLRYSDRPADFRTEVLELMATQTVKNGQIVPTGAKGGFVLRNCDAPDDAFVQHQYRNFVRSLLALTDNVVDGVPCPPPGINVAPEDMDDPYLVVAADKGTASYSDLANAESEAADFWLGDAFASGGRHGYDHKAIGITARGAWVCAAQHLAGLGMDAYRDGIRVVGIGDMSGDVFGNGMLLNAHMHLLAAFNHRHIFLDPHPDPQIAYDERRRLFEVRLGWDGYDKACISGGGGVFKRSAKRIALSPDVQQALGVTVDSLSGEALIRAILCAPVDMLYNGGIGTYVRASHERDSEVFDPANNAVRVAANQLRAKVVCEGGNLGLTQAARLEFAAAGGRINTDAIDNSGGVDMSDHEVNLKILFSATCAALPMARRNHQLRSLSESVTGQCLDNSLMQSRALSLAATEAEQHPARLRRLRDVLLEERRISVQTDPGIGDVATLGLRPQLAVLLGHEKNRLHERLAECQFHLQKCFSDPLLKDYFPAAIRHRFADAIAKHPLADHIMRTMAANHVVNHLGLCSVHHLQSLLEHPAGEVVIGMLSAEFLLDGDGLRRVIWQQGLEQTETFAMQRRLQELQLRFAEDLLRLCPVGDMDERWLRTRRTALARYARSRLTGGKETLSARLAILPELSRSAAALHLSASMHVPLPRALAATKVCHDLLPLQHMQAALRTPEWSDDVAHALRREWLHRLSRLRTIAIQQLLLCGHRDLRKAGLALWSPHRHWPALSALREKKPGEKMERMELLLLLARCESLLSEGQPQG
jgi:glutamate dehydrogenase